MQHYLTWGCVLVLATGTAFCAQGQTRQRTSDSLSTLTTVKADASAGDTRNGGDTAAYVELSPVPVTANVHETANSHYSLLSPLAGTLIPQNIISENLNNYVVSYIKNYYLDNSLHLQAMQSRGQSYFDIIEKVFERFGIPMELKYLAVIESGLNTNARSRVGAVGSWQFMASTARILGLTVNSHRDDRRDFYKSTVAAAKYLNRLHDMLDNWLLVVAAYNCGPGGVQSAMDRSGSNNFWDLEKYLPSESRQHVMKFIATAYILDRFANFFGVEKADYAQMFTNPAPASEPEHYGTLATLDISGKYSLAVIAKYLSMDINELNRMNPGFSKLLSTADNKYQLRLPADKMILFKDKRSAILNESVQLLMDNNRQITRAAYPAAKPLATPSPSKKG